MPTSSNAALIITHLAVFTDLTSALDGKCLREESMSFTLHFHTQGQCFSVNTNALWLGQTMLQEGPRLRAYLVYLLPHTRADNGSPIFEKPNPQIHVFQRPREKYCCPHLRRLSPEASVLLTFVIYILAHSQPTNYPHDKIN